MTSHLERVLTVREHKAFVLLNVERNASSSKRIFTLALDRSIMFALQPAQHLLERAQPCEDNVMHRVFMSKWILIRKNLGFVSACTCVG